MVKHSSISTRARLATDGRNINKKPRLATRLHLRESKARTRWPTHPSEAHAHNKEMVNRLSYQGEEGLQQIAETSIKEASLQQGDGARFLNLKENKACNKWPKPPSRDKARNKDMVNHSCISKQIRAATSGPNIHQRARNNEMVSHSRRSNISKRTRFATDGPHVCQRTRLGTRTW